MECYILGAGEFSGFYREPNGEDCVIAADGGYALCQKLGLKPDWVLGDFDSLGTVPQGTNVIQVPVEKDDTDMMLAVKHGLQLGHTVFHLYGGTGGRLDHTIANLQTLLYLKTHGGEGWLYDQSGRFTVLMEETKTFPAQERGILSLFAMGGSAEDVTVLGGKYTLEHGTLSENFPLGVSNHFAGEPITVTVSRGALLVGILQE